MRQGAMMNVVLIPSPAILKEKAERINIPVDGVVSLTLFRAAKPYMETKSITANTSLFLMRSLPTESKQASGD
jgi:hypothetical protein